MGTGEISAMGCGSGGIKGNVDGAGGVVGKCATETMKTGQSVRRAERMVLRDAGQASKFQQVITRVAWVAGQNTACLWLKTFSEGHQVASPSMKTERLAAREA